MAYFRFVGRFLQQAGEGPIWEFYTPPPLFLLFHSPHLKPPKNESTSPSRVGRGRVRTPYVVIPGPFVRHDPPLEERSLDQRPKLSAFPEDPGLLGIHTPGSRTALCFLRVRVHARAARFVY